MKKKPSCAGLIPNIQVVGLIEAWPISISRHTHIFCLPPSRHVKVPDKVVLDEPLVGLGMCRTPYFLLSLCLDPQLIITMVIFLKLIDYQEHLIPVLQCSFLQIFECMNTFRDKQSRETCSGLVALAN